MRMSPVPFSLAPRVVFDLRDWYRSTFTADQVPGPTSGTNVIRSIVRVPGSALFLAEPTDPRDPHWPFAETMELVTQTSAGGIRAFHGRVRTAEGVLLNRTFRQLISTTKCQVTIQVRGFRPHIEQLEIPGIGGHPALIEPIDLFPAADYSFPSGPRQPSLLEGAVRRIDGTGLSGATIKASAPDSQGGVQSLFETSTTGDGRYLVILDALLDEQGTTSFSRIDVELNHPDWNAPIVRTRTLLQAETSGKFIPPRREVFATTVVTGSVVRGDRPLPGAFVSLSCVEQPLLTGTVRTNTFGAWEFYGDARLPLSGIGKLRVTANGHPDPQLHDVHFGQRNAIAPVLLP